MKSYLLAFAMLLACVFGINAADIVTSDPTPLQQSSKNVVIYFHADQGNKTLKGSAASTEIYAHTGVITSDSKSDSDWKHAPDWGTNTAKYKLEYVSTDLWKLNIGDIRTYYGMTANETPVKLAFVFRNSNSSKQGKTEKGGDIFIDVLPEGFQVSLTSDLNSQILRGVTTGNFTISSTAAANLSLEVNGTVVKSENNATKLTAPFTFTSAGNYTVTAKGVNGSVTETASMTYCYLSPATAQTYPGGVPKQGAVRQSDGSVLFCLAAPNKSTVILVPSWNDFQPDNKYSMKYQDYNGNRYFWTSVSGLDPDKIYTYYYNVDGTYNVGDPYAKLILDPYNDRWISESIYPNMPEYPSKLGDIMLAVYHENINQYDWKVRNFKGVDKQNLVVYELLLRDFTGTEGKANANGTLRSAMNKLPYLKELGVNAIELLPVNEFNGNNSWGYNPNFYFAPDKAYGTPDDYKEFIDMCHSNGIAVILDLVFNQSDGLHPWYQMYDINSNPFYNKNAPHSYSVLNDWKQDHPLVLQQWQDCVKYWLSEYKVDGFRFDLVKGLGDNASYGNTDAYNKTRVERMKKIHAAAREVNPDAYFINELLGSAQEENEMATDGQINWANINEPACQYAMGYSAGSNLNRFNAEKDSRTWGCTVSYAESHDEQRMGYKQDQWGVSGVKGNREVSKRRIGSVHAQMILSPGAHMIWQFSELGNNQTTKDANGGNDTSPKIVNWSALDDPDTEGLYHNVRDLIHLRTHNTELFEKDAIKRMDFAESSWANGRFLHLSKNNKTLILVCNPNVAADKTFDISSMLPSRSTGDYKIASASYNTLPVLNAEAGTLTVPANAYAVITTSNVSGIEGSLADSTDIEVYAVGGQIIINGDYNSARVFNAAGAMMPQDGLTPGIYMVNVDGKTFKVAVR